MDILISVATKIAEYTVAPIGRQVGYLIFYKKNFKELDSQVNELEGLKERNRHSVEAEIRNGKVIEADVQNWLKQVDEMTDKAKLLSDDPRRAKVGCSKWPFPGFWSRHQLSREAKKMGIDVVELQKKWNFAEVGYLPPVDVLDNSPAPRGNEKLESRKKMKEDIVLALKESKLRKIGVYGLGGVGKSTLVNEVAKQVKEDKVFAEVVIANVSKTPTLDRIQGEIADQLGLRFEDTTPLGRAARLRERIRNGENVLIILDDIWTKLHLKDLGIPLEGATLAMQGHEISSKDNHRGCTLLLTSRFQGILQEMEIQKEFRLEVLNEKETWSLFEVMIGDIVNDSSLREIATQVATKCAGLPVVVVTIARALKNRDINHWKDALRVLERVGNKELNEIISSALEFCYNALEGDDIKALFLLCGLQSWVDDLLKYGYGLGIFKETYTVEEARCRFSKMISDLKASCLLLQDDTNLTVKMHDTVCEVAISIASRDHHVLTTKRYTQLEGWPSELFLKNCTQIFLDNCGIKELPERLDCPDLKFLVLNSRDNRSLNLPPTFFEGMKNLEVLDLSGMIISSLPTSLASLTKLKTLCFDDCDLGEMCAIGALKKLEILSFVDSSMTRLPSEIGQLSKIKMLDLTSCRVEVFPPNILSKLTNLEELYMGDSTIKWGVENSSIQNGNATLSELKHLTKLTTLELQLQEASILPRELIFERLQRFKIVIGDKWEWSGGYGASRLLKLKLGTSIHLDHGIKTLIEKAEDLYLDEIKGISNVLYQLSGDGFSELKNLHIQNNANLHHVIDSKERNQTFAFFPKLVRLILQNLNKLEKICDGPLTSKSFDNLNVIKVKSCSQLEYLFLATMVKALPQLAKIEVTECNSMKNIVHMDCWNGGKTIDKIEFIQLQSLSLQHLPTMAYFSSDDSTSSSETLRTNTPTSFFNTKVAFLNLVTLKLCSLNLNKVWDGDNISMANSFQNLANLTVEDCDGLKYLFSPFMVENLKNLRMLEVSKCDMMEEIITTEGRNNEIVLNEDRFWKLEKIIINDMKNLKIVWQFQFEGLKSLEVNKCEKLETIFPCGHMMVKEFASLETLKVTDCASVEEIFQFDGNGIHRGDYTTQLKTLILLELPKMKQIWSSDPHEKACFSYLEAVRVEKCLNLEYVFPFSVAKDLSELQDLSIINCGIKEIVSRKDGSMEMEGTPIFKLNHLSSLELGHLKKLKGFYGGAHSLECESLKKLNVFNCKQLKVFETQTFKSQESSLTERNHFSMQQPLFTVEKVVANLEELTLTCGDADIILQHHQFSLSKLHFLRISLFEEYGAAFPHSFLQCTPNLKWLVVQSSSFKEIFCDETLTDHEGRLMNQFSPKKLEKLTLYVLPELQHICEEGSPIHPLLQFLEFLNVDECSSLRNLVPSSVTFCFLTYMEIENCSNMINLITPSTATSLVKLETMIVKGCNSLEEIVTEDHVDAETKGEIISFHSLEILELENLERLNCFSSSKCFLKFPLLEKATVKQCPRMKIFSDRGTNTPKLKKVVIDEKVQEWCWEGDLNGTIEKMFLDKVGSLKHLELSKYPKLEKMWYRFVGPKQFYCLRSLVVQGCDWLSNFLISLKMLQSLSNLEELEIRECGSLEVVFDLEGTSERARVGTITSQLKKVTISNLVKLKHIWKHDIQEIVSFGDEGQQLQMPEIVFSTEKVQFSNLEVVRIEGCPNLEHLFPFSIAKDLRVLQDLSVNECGIKEIVSKREGHIEGTTPIFELNHLASLQLRNLHKLKGFYEAKPHSLECQSLKRLNVFNCKQFKIFETTRSHLPQVIGNLEELTLTCGDADIILQHHQFPLSKLQLLRISKFEEYGAAFPHSFLQCTPNLKWLNVEWSSFKEIFCDETLTDHEGRLMNQFSPKKLEKLTLYELPELQHIYQEGSPIDPLLQFLQVLLVYQCSNLRNLVPSSVTFCFLTYMKIENCNNMINLITPSTATSLVKLETMKVKGCNSLEEIVREDHVDAETKGEIIEFSSLEFLELENLERLSCFSSSKWFFKFPLLEKVAVRQCPRMNIFIERGTSTPRLKRVLTDEKDEEWCWEADLNGTINKIFLDKVAFCNKKHLKLSEYPELKDLWYGPVGNKVFCNLKILVVHKCDFLSNVLLSSNLQQALHSLEELEVSECDSIEAVFDVRVMGDTDLHVKETSQLKKLTLSSLSNLKHIWSNDPSKIISYRNLQVVKVVECQNLIHMFSVSLCKDLLHLEELTIESCGIEEIIAIEEGSVEARFDFPHLTILRLIKLTKLTSFYPGRHTLECPSLKTLNVYLCEALEIFTFDKVDEVEFSSQKALFNLQKVSSNLKELSLNKMDAVRILDDLYEKNLFNSMEILRLQYFQETSIMLLNDILERFSGATTLQVRCSSFTSLFLTEEISQRITKSCPKIRKLWLYQLDQLKHIWNDGCVSDPFVQNLEALSVIECCSLTRLTPPSISFTNLTILQVKDCKGMIYLMTSSTAKSLVHLRNFKIINCEMIEEVVQIDEGESEEEINFESLMHLELNSLSSLKSFGSGKHTFIFPSLITLIVRGCHKMQNFSSGLTVAPVLTVVEVENGKKRWKEDLNTTITQLFLEKGTSDCES